MFRRSNSSTNIPVPKPKVNLFGCKDSRDERRSKSTTRLSQRDSAASTSYFPRQHNSLDRKSSTVGLRATPLHRTGARPPSLLRTTPSSALSQRRNSSRSPSSCRKDGITIQKLANDKRWVADQFLKVQDFIMSSNLFDLNVVDCTKLKPPSINNFIYIMGVLLAEIFPKLKISKENYKEVIPTKLKVLKYPGTVTNSVLKTVNTMHSWPQIIAMWSWLIEKVSLSRNVANTSSIEHLEPEEKMKFLLRQNVQDFFIRRYHIFNNYSNDNPQKIEKANKEYVNNLAEYLNVDFEVLKHLQTDINIKKKYRSKQEEETEELRAGNAKMRSEIEEMKNEIEEFQANDTVEEAELNSEIQTLHENLEETTEAVTTIKKNISQLQDTIKEQPCTYQEKLALLKQIEELKSEVEMKKEKILHAKELKNKFDHQLTTEISKLQSLAIQWNRSLLEVTIKKPHLQKLRLREKGFHDPKFLDELQEVADYKNKLETEVTVTLPQMKKDLKETYEKKSEIDKEIEKYNEDICKAAENQTILTKKIKEIDNEIKVLVNELEERKVTHFQVLQKLQEEYNLKAQIELMSKLKKRKEDLHEEVSKFGQKMISFFVELHNQVVKNLTKMEDVKEACLRKLREMQKDMAEKQMEVLKMLEDEDEGS